MLYLLLGTGGDGDLLEDTDRDRDLEKRFIIGDLDREMDRDLEPDL
jgi:hypothetical protein